MVVQTKGEIAPSHQVMYRRSARLLCGGYYNPDEEFEPNISYHENPVKVFKKKLGTRKASHASSRANSDASSSTTDTPVNESQSDGLSQPLRTCPTLTPSSSQSQTPRCSNLAPLEESSHTEYSCSRPSLHLGPNHEELSQSEVDCSGYSSSEETHRKSAASTSSNCIISSDNGAVAAKSNAKTTLANFVGLRRSSSMKKAYGVYLLLFILLLPCVWFFLPLLTSFISSTTLTKTPTQEKPKTEPVVPVPAPPQPMHVAPVVDPGVLLAAKVADMQHILRDNFSSAAILRLRNDALSNITDFGRPMADKMADFALETQGASVIMARSSETYRPTSMCVTLFGFPVLYLNKRPHTVIQGNPVLAGKCWPFHGAQGTLAISLSHPIMITHVTLDHLPRYNSPTGSIDSAPKDFEIYGMKNDSDEGTLLGCRFTYDEHGEPTQTFNVPNPGDEIYRAVELRVLSNWGNVKYTCLYRFRVHGKIANP